MLSYSSLVSISELLLACNPFNLQSSRVDIAIAILRAVSVEVAVGAIPVLDEVVELGLQSLERVRAECLALEGVEVEADLEFDAVLIHCSKYIGTVIRRPAFVGWPLRRTSSAGERTWASACGRSTSAWVKESHESEVGWQSL